jgi:hypothetical protein
MSGQAPLGRLCPDGGMGGICTLCGEVVKKHHIVALALFAAWVIFALFVTGWYKYIH